MGKSLDRNDSLSFGKMYKMPSSDMQSMQSGAVKNHGDDFNAPLANKARGSATALAGYNISTNANVNNTIIRPIASNVNVTSKIQNSIVSTPTEIKLEEQRFFGEGIGSFDDVWRKINVGGQDEGHQQQSIVDSSRDILAQIPHMQADQYQTRVNQQQVTRTHSSGHPSQNVQQHQQQHQQYNDPNIGSMSRLLHYNSGGYDTYNMPLLHHHLVPSITQKSNELHALLDHRKSGEIAAGWNLSFMGGRSEGVNEDQFASTSPSSNAPSTTTGHKRRLSQSEREKADEHRMQKNRESAKRSRQRRAEYTKELEDAIEKLNEENYQIRRKIQSEIFKQHEQPIVPSKFNKGRLKKTVSNQL